MQADMQTNTPAEDGSVCEKFINTDRTEQKRLAGAMQAVAGAAVGVLGAMKGERFRHVVALSAVAIALGVGGSPAFAQDSNSGDSGDGESACDGSDECSDESETTGEPLETNEGEITRDEDNCEDNGGGNGGAGEEEPDGPSGKFPVNWETGEKWETESDLIVRLPGADFKFTRQYTSDPSMADNPYSTSETLPVCVDQSKISANIGSGWGWSNLRAGSGRMRWRSLAPSTAFAGDGVDITLIRPARKPKFLSGAPGGVVFASGPGNQVVEGDFDPDDFDTGGGIPSACDSLPLSITYSEPGRWGQTFDMTDGIGWITTDIDEIGNYRLYQDTDSDAKLLPDQILFNGSSKTWNDPDMVDAWIEIKWDSNRVVRADVYRPSASGGVITQTVQYYHLVNDNGLKVKYHDGTSYTTLNMPGTNTPVNPATSVLGTEGDLVMVVRSTATEPSNASTQWRRRVTQYRYHDGSNAPQSGDIRLRIEGNVHQLKSVFQPQQIEHMAQIRSSNGSPTDMAVVNEAIQLLEVSDGVAFDGGTSDLMYEVANKVVTYDPITDRVDWQFVQSGSCGCGSGGATNGVAFSYEWLNWTRSYGGQTVNGTSLHMREHSVSSYSSFPTTVYRSYLKDIMYLNPGPNEQPYVWNQVLVDGDVPTGATSDAWVRNRKTSSTTRSLTGTSTPSSVSSYTPAIGTTEPSITISTTEGLETQYSYDGENAGSISRGVSGNTEEVLKRVYVDSVNSSRRRLIQRIERPRVAGTSFQDKIEVVEFDYGYETTTTSKLDWKRTRVEREIEAENGPADPPQWVESWEFYDDKGQRIVTLDPDGSVNRYEYDARTGTLAKVTRNYDPTAVGSIPEIRLPTGANGEPSDPFTGLTTNTTGTLITEYTRDLRGRVTKVIRPGGVQSWTMRGLDEDASRSGILYYSVIRMPHQVASPGEYAGPASKRLMDAASKTIRSEQWDVEDDGSYDPGNDDYATNKLLMDSTELARSVTSHDVSGQMISKQSWWDIANNFSATTSYAYDEFGRVKTITDAEGTITSYTTIAAPFYGYDVLDRAISTRVGVSGSLATVTEYFYDGDPGAPTPAQGVGNGNLTAVKLYDGETANARITRMYYDDRDRLIATVSPDAPLSLTRYDNLDRPIESAVYPEPTGILVLNDVQSIISAAGDLPVTDANLKHPTGGQRSWHTLTDYGQRGYVWRQRTAIDPGMATPEYLSSLSWFDAEGNELASWGPNSPMTVYEYDEHDRVSTLYISDRKSEVDGTLDFSTATSVAGDNVLEQAEYTYNYTTGGGVLELVKTKMRAHDATTTGALADADSITSYLGLIYDSALRRVATVNFGTNKTDFSTGTSTAPTLSNYDTLAELRSATDVIFSWQKYNMRGSVEDMVSIQSGTNASDEIVTRYQYDDFYRTIATIENYQSATLAWDVASGRYAVTGLDYTDPSKDRVTSFVYDKVGKVTKRVAHLPANPSGETVQVTEYEYGTATGSSSAVMDSLVASNNLLKRVKYPDEGTGESGASSKYYVDYAYNRLGELRGVTDQNRTIRKFERDEQGRVLADIVDTIITNTGTNARNIDGAIRRIGYEYDMYGRMMGSTSHTSTVASGNVRDDVEIGYTPLWQVKTVAQQHDGDVTGSSPTVEYVYTNADANGAAENYSRLTEIKYPKDIAASNAGTVKYVYAAGVDDRLSRVATMQVLGLNHKATGGVPDFENLVTYDRIGLGMVAMTSVNVGSIGGWDVVQDRTVNQNGTGPSTGITGAYPSFDRFGRVVSHMWVRDDFGPYTGSSQTYSGPNLPAFMNIGHTYDRSSNRLSYDDNRQGAQLPDRTRDFKYDRMNRLTEELRPDVPVASVYTPQQASQQWNLDMLGNWDDRTIDADHDGEFIDNGGVNYFDDREHNQANEIESGLQYDQRLYTSGIPTFYDHAYDDNGNMTDERKGKSLPIPPALMAGQLHTYDAWNRLVKSEYINSTGVSTTISENTYNALGWRTSKKFDTSEGAYDGMDQKRLYYYGADWRMVEERIDTDVNTNTIGASGLDDDADWISQQFWGLRYIDDAVAKRVDRDTGGADGDWIDSDATYWYQLTDTQFSVGVVLDQEGNVYERIDYDAYGQARHRYGGDANGDGIPSVNPFANDFNLNGGDNLIDETNYHVDLDVDCDGVFDTTDIGTILTNTSNLSFTSLPVGWISDPNSATGPDNAIGYAGYIFNHEREDYSVRFRVYDPGLGRFMTRDPIGYVGGGNVYGYVGASPTNFNDSMGLRPGLFARQLASMKRAQKNNTQLNGCEIAKLAVAVAAGEHIQNSADPSNLLAAISNALEDAGAGHAEAASAVMDAVNDIADALDDVLPSKRAREIADTVDDLTEGSGDLLRAVGTVNDIVDFLAELNGATRGSGAAQSAHAMAAIMKAMSPIASMVPGLGTMLSLYGDLAASFAVAADEMASRIGTHNVDSWSRDNGYATYKGGIWTGKWGEGVLKNTGDPAHQALICAMKNACKGK